MSDKPRYWVVIPAAGIGKRVGADQPKQYITIHSKTILEHTIDCFIERADITGIVVAIAKDDPYWQTLAIHNHEKIITAPGGKERFQSVTNSLHALLDMADQNDWVMVHDAARPCLSQAAIDRLIKELAQHDVGGILAMPCRDTMKRADSNNDIVETVEREQLWHAQTPQMFRYHFLLSALNDVVEQSKLVTDEAMAIEQLGLQPKLIQGHHENLKITHKDDLQHAETYLV